MRHLARTRLSLFWFAFFEYSWSGCSPGFLFCVGLHSFLLSTTLPPFSHPLCHRLESRHVGIHSLILLHQRLDGLPSPPPTHTASACGTDEGSHRPTGQHVRSHTYPIDRARSPPFSLVSSNSSFSLLRCSLIPLCVLCACVRCCSLGTPWVLVRVQLVDLCRCVVPCSSPPLPPNSLLFSHSLFPPSPFSLSASFFFYRLEISEGVCWWWGEGLGAVRFSELRGCRLYSDEKTAELAQRSAAVSGRGIGAPVRRRGRSGAERDDLFRCSRSF